MLIRWSLPILLLIGSPALAQLKFVDGTEASGLPLSNVARLSFAFLDDDVLPDVLLRDGSAYRVFLNRAGKFSEVQNPGLPAPAGRDLLTCVDIDNDGLADAIFMRYLDPKSEKFVAPTAGPLRTCWLKGNGDGTFQPARIIEAATPGTISAFSVGDANGDGLPDLVFGNWYDHYLASVTAYPADLLLQQKNGSFARAKLPEDGVEFTEEADGGPRPTYGW